MRCGSWFNFPMVWIRVLGDCFDGQPHWYFFMTNLKIFNYNTICSFTKKKKKKTTVGCRAGSPPVRLICICHSGTLCSALNASACSKLPWIFTSMVWPLKASQGSVLQPVLLAVTDSVSSHFHPQVIIRGIMVYGIQRVQRKGTLLNVDLNWFF